MSIANAALRLLRAFAVAAMALVSVSPALAGSYLDNTLGDLKAEDRIAVADPKPVQLLFEFQNNGAPNAKAQTFLLARVTADVKASGLFLDVSDGPATGGAVLSVVLNNVADLKKAEAKGVATGLTLGLAASTVTDGYVCTVTYLGSDPNAAKIAKTEQHAIYTTIGLFGSTPPNATKMKSQEDAVYTMTDQVLAHALNDLAADPAFNPNAPAPKAPAAAAAPPAQPPASAPQPQPASQP